MTASSARPPARVYRSQVVMAPADPDDPMGSKRGYLFTSLPHPIHQARVYPRRDGHWDVVMLTTWLPRAMTCESESVACATAAEWVGLSAGRALQTFSGLQRQALGQGRCPRLGAEGLCLQAADVGAVWCPDHPKGRRREPVT